MSNIHADLIKNATDMQSQLLEFSHQLSNLSLKSLDDQINFKMTEAPTFTSSNLAGTASPSTVNSVITAGTYISVTSGVPTTFHRLTSDVIISEAKGNYDLTNKLDPAITSSPDVSSIDHDKIMINTFPVTKVVITFGSDSLNVNIPSTGVPLDPPTASGAPTLAQQSVAKAMAVVAMNLRGVGVGVADIQEIFKNGITPTSLAAVESQLKGHHDAVLQLSLESLSRVTNILQKIAQKLGS
jgi:hypothetical protein